MMTGEVKACSVKGYRVSVYNMFWHVLVLWISYYSLIHLKMKARRERVHLKPRKFGLKRFSCR